MTLSKSFLPVMLIACAATAWGQEREPHIGYLYPAGGRQGTTFSVSVGGQFLERAAGAYVSGEGVSAKVSGYEGPFGLLNGAQFQELMDRLQKLREKRVAEQAGKNVPARPPAPAAAAAKPDGAKPGSAPAGKGAAAPPKRTPVALPDLPELRNLDEMSLMQLRQVTEKFVRIRNSRPKPPLAETATLEVTIAPDAALGDREIRLRTPAGLTNPLLFEVGRLPEVRKPDRNNAEADNAPSLRGQQPRAVTEPARAPEAADDLGILSPPMVLNGQILGGQVDRFRFRAQRGQKLVITTQARRLIPYLADAVPGWFQAVVTVSDAKGRELAAADHYRFDPDPVLFLEVPADGEYVLEIHDSIYRGRADFVYRIAVGEQPFITQMFPLGARAGTTTTASISGWNLPERRLRLDTQAGCDRVRRTAWSGKEGCSNSVKYAVDTLPECEAIASSAALKAQRVTLPQIINGRISHPGDTNVFRFQGRAGDEVVAEVYARRLGSPLDSLLRLADATGQVLAWNDDFEDKGEGLLTHQADSCLRVRLPADGTYYVYLTDAQNAGSDAHAYRLRISAPQPDFALRLTPSSLNVGAGRPVAVTVHALRKDGFDGEIAVSLKNAPPGFALAGARIPSGRDSVRMTLTAPRVALDQPVALQLEGRATISGAVITRPVVPAEDLMQAFAYRHLVPEQELLVAVTGARRWMPNLAPAEAGPLGVPAGGTAQLRIQYPPRAPVADIKFDLSEPPKGVTLADVSAVPGGFSLVVKAAADSPPAGYADNLIVEAYTETTGRPGTPAAQQKRRVFLGILPAIPFEIVKP